MKRVLHIRQSARYSGLERLILQVAAPLRERGYETATTILYTRRGVSPEVARELPSIHPMIEISRSYGVEVDQIVDRTKWPLGMARRVAKRVRAGRFDLLHTHGFKENLVGLLAARMARAPIVSTAHGFSQAFRRLALYRRLDLLLLRGFPRVLAVSAAVRRQLLAAGLRPERVCVVHGALDVADFSAHVDSNTDDVRRSLSIEPGCPVISFVARLSPEKGHIFFLHAARKVLDHRPEARFLVIGEGPLRAKLEHTAEALSLDRGLRFLGFRTDAPTLISASDLVVLPSVKEGLPDVLLEAAALAKPVVASRVGGISEIVRHGVSGLLVPPADPDALAEAVLDLIRRPDEARSMGMRGREVVRREFSVDRMARRVARVYNELME